MVANEFIVIVITIEIYADEADVQAEIIQLLLSTDSCCKLALLESDMCLASFLIQARSAFPSRCVQSPVSTILWCIFVMLLGSFVWSCITIITVVIKQHLKHLFRCFVSLLCFI